MGFLQFFMQELPAAVHNTAAEKLTLLDFAIKGGWVMIPIISAVAGSSIYLY